MKMTKKLKLLAGCVLSLFSLFSPAFAFQYGSPSGTGVWCCSTIVYRVNVANPHFQCFASPVSFQPAVQAAAGTWSQAQGQATLFQLQEGPTTTVVCDSLDNINSVAMTPGSEFEPGEVAFSITRIVAGCILEADICFNDALSWFGGGAGCGGRLGEANREDGSIIWTDECNDFTAPVMCNDGNNPACLQTGETKRGLTDDDIAGLLWAYSGTGRINSNERAIPREILPNSSCVYPTTSKDPCPLCHCALCEKPVSCNGITPVDSMVLICPRAEEASYRVFAYDTCGNPPPCLNTNNTHLNLDFSHLCPAAEPCLSSLGSWPYMGPLCVQPPELHRFPVDAGSMNCSDCYAQLFLVKGLTSTLCKDSIKVKFFDTNGDKCVTPDDYTGGSCNDYNLSGSVNDSDLAIFQQHLNHDCIVRDKGDLDGNLFLEAPDVCLLLICVFVGSGNGICCGLSFADVTWRRFGVPL